jgi:hypothetical protein
VERSPVQLAEVDNMSADQYESTPFSNRKTASVVILTADRWTRERRPRRRVSQII